MGGKGPLHGVKVIEFAGLAPTPFAGLILADYGASVTRIDLPKSKNVPTSDILTRNKRSIAVDAKHPQGRTLLLKLIDQADVLLDPFRPDVLERLGFGPAVFHGSLDGEVQTARNKGLVYARVAGFSEGPYRKMAGHDINYIALSGILSMLPGPDKPSFPLNLLADFAGGGLLCALGVVLALFARQQTGFGQVVDVDMVSGARYISSFPLLQHLTGFGLTFGKAKDDGGSGRGTGLLDGGAPFYGVYTCADGKWMSVGCLEPQFFKVFVDKFVGALPKSFVENFGWVPEGSTQTKHDELPRLRKFMEEGFFLMSRDEWATIFADSDACCVPILSPSEAAALSNSEVPAPHPSLQGVQTENLQQPSTLVPGQNTEEILQELGIGEDEMRMLWASGALGSPRPKL